MHNEQQPGASAVELTPLSEEQIRLGFQAFVNLSPSITVPANMFAVDIQTIDLGVGSTLLMRNMLSNLDSEPRPRLTLPTIEPTIDELLARLIVPFGIFSNPTSEHRNDSTHRQAQERDEIFARFRRRLNTMRLTDGAQLPDGPEYQPDDDTPNHYICYITREVMRDPVFVAPDNRCYERKALQEWHDHFNVATESGRLPPRCIINRDIGLSNPQELPTNPPLQAEIMQYLQERRAQQSQTLTG